MSKHIIDFNNGETMSLEVIIKRSDFRLAKNGKNFLSLVFEDKSGQIPGKYWDASEDDAKKYHIGAIVQLEGRRDLYQGKPQVNITRLGLLDADTVDMSQFVQTAPMKRADMENEFEDVFLQITNGAWNRIVRYLFKKYHDQFFTSAAAKSNHHDFQGGLAFHTLSMVRMAEKISDLYPQINRALLIAGACLHDFGKIIELTGSLDIEYTFEGNMLGHITIVDEEIVKAATDLDISLESEDMILLRHMILSHHGLLEYGSPERPKILEAEVLHNIDMMDASINMITKALDKTEEGKFSERIFGLDNRSFYKHS
ncbi:MULTISPECIES: 3'-5' exoribonuclease YhaM family protein [Companilactobacillus]|uniref:Metal-dependent phosphohydrolase n=4 Tax=Companilactobacillus TaxID=2767879 RepID=A0ABR5NQM0_9LACO|nr:MULTISPECIES: HD domain-containing protein [Companilactobacillus]GEO46837.1 3'-5' exoribonuclease YhaM [Companilactobacillus paralimentarius]KRK49951.1 metal-dependent phosphohydrolase [Companilactobacillus kimchii DSM 13961 = JCM 10707]KRK83755.1 metal-dependent phosphohydrolase [Companilactobacillus bobalius DSM 19674]OVE96147.1 3'-5' exoribonuclease YhaM [Companilactobacillus bobalius]OWF33078.1 3'-5' exoribonuclease YhaM [Companilactobacillus kimchii]